MASRIRFIVATTLVMAAAPLFAAGQDAPKPTPLAVLVAELTKSNPDVLAAKSGAQAASYRPQQVSSLPDPHVSIQEFAVGNPLPFAGYATSNFAYLGVGASQPLPYPGKLALRGAVARDDASVAQAHVEIVSRDRIERLRTTYAQLAYLQATLSILERDQQLLITIAQQAQSRYASGEGKQQDVLRAQLESTKILREISMNHQAAGEAQAQLKQLVARPQDSPDIVTEPLAATFLRQTNADLLNDVRAQNADLRERSAMVTRDQAAVTLAQKEYRPDFGVSFMYQNTGPRFPDYYMATFDVTFHRRAPLDAALAEARLNVDGAREQHDAALQAALADAERQFVIVKTSEEQLPIYRDGLIPQAQTSIQAGLAAYQANREDFRTLMSSFLDVLNLDLQYQQTLLDHEIAIARLERLTGITLP